MNYPHFDDPDLSNFPPAVTLWESYANQLALLEELSSRGARAKRLTIKAVALGEQTILRLYDARARLEDLQLRADKLAKIVRLADAEHGPGEAAEGAPA